MPSSSEKQRKLMCIALAVKQGKTAKSYSKQAEKVSKQMSEDQLKEFCKKPVKGDNPPF